MLETYVDQGDLRGPALQDADDETQGWNPCAYPSLERDYQRLKVYRAGWALRKALPEEPLTGRQIHEFIDNVWKDKWFMDRFGEIRIRVETSRRRKNSACCVTDRRAGVEVLKFPTESVWVTRTTALHELAHALTKGQHHGPIFCSVLLQLVIHYMGSVVGRELYRQFKINGVQLCG